jgi:hypothetical protein
MKISVIGSVPDKDKEAYMSMVDTFIQDHKVSVPVVMSAGNVEVLHMIEKYAKKHGYNSIIFGNVFELAVLNANKIIFIWDGINKVYADAIELAKANSIPYITLRTK